MQQKALETSAPRVLLTGLAMGESPRWHDGRLWLSDWGAQEIVAVDSEGRSEVILRVPFLLPFCFDWLRDGPLVVVSGREGRVLRTGANRLVDELRGPDEPFAQPLE